MIKDGKKGRKLMKNVSGNVSGNVSVNSKSETFLETFLEMILNWWKMKKIDEKCGKFVKNKKKW